MQCISSWISKNLCTAHTKRNIPSAHKYNSIVLYLLCHIQDMLDVHTLYKYMQHTTTRYNYIELHTLEYIYIFYFLLFCIVVLLLFVWKHGFL